MIRQDFRPNYARASRTGVGPGKVGEGRDESNGVMGPNAVAAFVNGMERNDSSIQGHF